MRLIDVYEHAHRALPLLYQLLEEREPHQCISHRAMPTYEQHCAFFWGRPYAHWYLAEVDGYPRGAVYLTHQREIGVGILRGQRGNRYGLDAVAELMRLHPGKFLANIAPTNGVSAAMFCKLGFGPQPIQHTYERTA